MASEVTVPIARGGKCKGKSRRKKARPREVLRPTDEKANFQRCTRLLIGGGTALLKEKFDQLCPPRDLPKVLADPSTKEKLLTEAKLTKPQWERLYPSRGAVAVSEDFDISLLFKLLTTITKIPAPDLGWNSKPHPKEVSLGADLARIKYYRNEVYAHVNQEMSLEEDKFHYYWDEIEEPLTRIAGSISREKKREWKKEIENFKSNPLTANEERYVEALEGWIEEDTETKERLRKVEDSVETLKEGLNELKEMLLKKPKCTVCEDAECRRKNHKGVSPLEIRVDSTEIGSEREKQDLLNYLGERYIVKTCEEDNEFSRYMEINREVIIIGAKKGSLIITVGCRSVQILEGLWNDYREGHLGEMVQKYLVTDEILNEFGLSEIKLATYISEEEYRRCLQDLELYSELEQKLAVVKGFRDGLQENFLAWDRMRESNVALLREFSTKLRNFPPRRAGFMGALFGTVAAALTSGSLLVGAAAAAGVGAAGAVFNKWNMQRKAKEEIIKERKVFDELQPNADSLKKPLAGLADFCQKHTDSVLSSRHLEGEFHLLSRMLQKQEPEDPKSTEGRKLANFIKDEVEKHYTSIRQPLELLSTSQNDEEISENICRILEQLKVGPGEQEIRAMISSFIEKEFADNFFSRD